MTANKFIRPTAYLAQACQRASLFSTCKTFTSTSKATTSIYRAPAIQKPTLENLRKIADTLGFHISPDELEDYKDVIDSNIHHLSALDDLPEPVLLPVKYPRTPGYRPSPVENTHNAWHYKTDIKGAASGKLKDKRVGIKDNVSIAGVPMMNGTKLLEGYIPECDATVVTRILDEGGHIVGKAVCESMSFSGSSCTSDSGIVYNAFDQTRSAGGSCSGISVLIHLGEVDVGIGCDQGGSMRIPAAWNGIVSFKPTHGLVPYTGIVPVEGTVDHCGPMARTVKDCALLLEVIAGYDDGLDPRQQLSTDAAVPAYSEMLSEDLSGMKIGLLQEGFIRCESDVSELVRASGKSLMKAGATVEDVSVPLHRSGYLIATAPTFQGGYHVLIRNGGCTLGQRGFQQTSLIDHMTKSMKTNANDLPCIMKTFCLEWEYIQQNYGTHYYAKGQNLTFSLSKAYEDALKKYDVLVLPTVPYKAPKLPPKDASVKELNRHCSSVGINTRPFDNTGHPALTINAGLSENLPIGMMIIGKKFDEATVLKVAYAFEQIRDAK